MCSLGSTFYLLYKVGAVKFFFFFPLKGTKRLTITNTRTLKMAEDVLSVRFSPDAKYIAVALLDSTIKVIGINF